MLSRIAIPLLAAMTVLCSAGFCFAQTVDTLEVWAEADSLAALGDVLYKLGNLDEALRLYEKSLDRYRQIGDKSRQAGVLDMIGLIQLDKGQLFSAEPFWAEALILAQESGNGDVECNMLRCLGYIHYKRYEIEKATDFMLRGLNLARMVNNRLVEARTLKNMSYIFYEYSKWDSSLTLGEQSLQLFREMGDKNSEAAVLDILGNTLQSIENYAKALDYFEKSLAIYAESGNLNGLSMVCIDISHVYLVFSDNQKAQDYTIKGLEYAQKSGNIFRVALAQHSLGFKYQVMDNHSESLACHQAALKIYEDLGDKANICIITNNIGNNYEGLGDFTLALEYFQKAMDLAQSIGQSRLVKIATSNMANVYFRLKQYNQSIALNQRALANAEKYSLYDEIQGICQELGDCYAAQGLDSLALIHYLEPIKITESTRNLLVAESQKTGYTNRFSEAYSNAILAFLKSDQMEQAYLYVERARARSFLDLLASAQVKVGKPEHREFLAKENEYYDQKQEIEQQIQAAGEDTAQVVALRGKLEGDWAGVLDRLEEQKREEPELASLVSVNPPTLPEVQALSDKETTLLEYFLTEEKTLIWLVTRKSAEVFQVEVGGDSLKSLVMDFREAIESQGQTDGLSRQLYELLIAPTADKIKAENLIVVPHGILHYLPFAALKDSEGNCLLENYRIAYLPSASVLKYLIPKRKPLGNKLLALGNPATERKGYDAIPLTEAEVKEIGGVYSGSQILTKKSATEAEFKRLAPQSDILHLACHGDLNSAYPMFSCLLLAPDSLEDGELDVHEIFNLDLNASLVVLSGCETGLGHLTNGDELVGLSRAFIYAGTPFIISSLWMVEDESTAFLMGRFYHHLKNQDKAEALRQAQLETRQKYPGLRSWASFVLTGEGM